MTDLAEGTTTAAPDEEAAVVALALPPLPPTDSCPWPVTYVDCAGECSAYEKWPEEDRAAAQAWFEAMASDYLFNWTGGVFGVCDVEVRPCRQDCAGAAAWGTTFWGRGPGFDPGFPRQGAGVRGAAPWFPVLVSGQWFNITCGCMGTCRCSPSGPASLSLPGPVQTITEVTIDGEVVPSTSYRLDNHRWLIRTDGETWPTCQDMNVAPDAIGSFVVRYTKGIPVPIGGVTAAGRLACELALAACGDEQCALPDRIQTITRQGLTVGVNTSDTAWEQTGIWSIDNWVMSVNQPKPFASVRSVDLPSLR